MIRIILTLLQNRKAQWDLLYEGRPCARGYANNSEQALQAAVNVASRDGCRLRGLRCTRDQQSNGLVRREYSAYVR